MSAFDQRVCEWLNTATIPPNKKQTVLNRVSVSISNYRALEIDKAHPAAAAAAIAASAAAAASASTSVIQTPRNTTTAKQAANNNNGQPSPAPNNAARTPGSIYKSRSSFTSPQSPSAEGKGNNSPSRASAAGGYTAPILEVDYSLQQQIAKALRRLQEGDEGDSSNPLFTTVWHHHNNNNNNNVKSSGDNNNDNNNEVSGAIDYDIHETAQSQAEEGEEGGAGNTAIEQQQRHQQQQEGGSNINNEPSSAPSTTTAAANAFKDPNSHMCDDGVDGYDEQPFGRPDNETGAYTVGFTFGEPAPDNFVGTHGAHLDELDERGAGAGEGGAGGADGEGDDPMTDREDARRRLTMKRKSRNAISAETVDLDAAMAFTAEAVEKDPAYTSAIIASLETHHLFSHLDDEDLAFVASIMDVRTYTEGERIVTKLEDADEMLVVVAGEALVTDTVTVREYEEHTASLQQKGTKATAASSSNANANAVNSGSFSDSDGEGGFANRNGTRLAVGKTIGDLGLMYHTIQPETIEAVAPVSSSSSATTTVCCALSRTAYKNICAKAAKVKRERYEGFLANVKFLQGLEGDERLRLAEALKSAKYTKGEKIIKYGEEGVWFNIILEGSVDVIGRDEAGNPVNVCSFKEGDSVGELEFIYGHKTVADCVAATPIVKTAKMTAKHFEKVIGPAKEVLERRATGDQVYSYYRQTNKVK